MLLLNSCSTTPDPVMVPLEIPGAHYVGNQACADCHKEIVRKFPTSPHARIHSGNALMVSQSGCESCHGPGSLNTLKPGEGGNFIINPHRDPASCFQCHLDVNAEFNLPHHHPVIEGHMSCVQCHDPHDGDIFKPAGGLAMARQNENCAQCHRDQTRPFVFEHQAMREGCIVCHSPHGSINQKMLVESDPNLCMRCHSQVQTTSGQIYIGNVNHTSRLQIGTCWASGCHTAVHGSNVDTRLRY